MLIKDIHIQRVNLGLKKPYTIAFKTVFAVESIIVEIELSNGMTGIGAANPSKEVTGESIDDTELALIRLKSSQWLKKKDLRHFNGLLSILKESLVKTPAALAAIDTALHDAFCKYLGIPVVEFLGTQKMEMVTSVTIGIKNVAETLMEAKEYTGNGFRVLKVKLGNNLEEDIERIKKLRETYKDSLVIRVDINQGYTESAAIKFIEATKDLDIELIEQPLPVNAFPSPRLGRTNRTRLAADESLLTSTDALKLLLHPVGCGIYNIKLMKCGGISNALDIAKMAEIGNVDLMWGCNDESKISITAALHAAFACGHTKYLDLDGSFDLLKDVVSGGFTVKDGMMRLTGNPGLGVVKN